MGDKVFCAMGGHQTGRTYAHIQVLKLLLACGEIDQFPVNRKDILDLCIEAGIKPSQIRFGDET